MQSKPIQERHRFNTVESKTYRGRRYNTLTYIAMVPAVFGGVLCVSGEAGSIAPVGLTLSLSAAALRAAKMIVQANILQSASIKVIKGVFTGIYFLHE